MESPIAKAMVIIRRPLDGAVLVSGNLDEDGRRYERPLGGHIEIGERSAETACRELREEIGQELKDLQLLGVIENLFTFNGLPAHEIVFVYGADFVDPSAYGIEQQTILDDPTHRVRVRWRALTASSPPLVPAGIERYISPSVVAGSSG